MMIIQLVKHENRSYYYVVVNRKYKSYPGTAPNYFDNLCFLNAIYNELKQPSKGLYYSSVLRPYVRDLILSLIKTKIEV